MYNGAHGMGPCCLPMENHGITLFAKSIKVRPAAPSCCAAAAAPARPSTPLPGNKMRP